MEGVPEQRVARLEPFDQRLLFLEPAGNHRHGVVKLRLAPAHDGVLAAPEIALVRLDAAQRGDQRVVAVEQRVAQLEHDLVEL